MPCGQFYFSNCIGYMILKLFFPRIGNWPGPKTRSIKRKSRLIATSQKLEEFQKVMTNIIPEVSWYSSYERVKVIGKQKNRVRLCSRVYQCKNDSHKTWIFSHELLHTVHVAIGKLQRLSSTASWDYYMKIHLNQINSQRLFTLLKKFCNHQRIPVPLPTHLFFLLPFTTQRKSVFCFNTLFQCFVIFIHLYACIILKPKFSLHGLKSKVLKPI